MKENAMSQFPKEVMNENFMSHNTLLLLIIFSNGVFCNKPINFIQSEIQEAFKNTPKIWHNYVRMFVHKYLKQIECICKTLIMNIFKILKYSLIFLKLKDKTKNTIGLAPEWILHMIAPSNSRRFNIDWPSGHFHIFQEQHYRYLFTDTFSYCFTLNTKIRLNVTFDTLTLQGAKCEHDKLEIYQKQRSQGAKCSNVIHQNEKSLLYTYCGKHSKFSVFPKFIKLRVFISLNSKNAFQLNATFCVIDNNLIFTPFNSPSRVKTSDIEVHPQCYKIGGKYYVTSFLLIVKKLYKIKLKIIQSEAKNYVVHDGPSNMI